MRDSTLLRQARTTTTGMLLWVSTLTVSLPSTTAETPRRPWEAITIASHPLFLAVSIIVSYGCSCSTCTTSQGTPAAVAASFAALRYFRRAQPSRGRGHVDNHEASGANYYRGCYQVSPFHVLCSRIDLRRR